MGDVIQFRTPDDKDFSECAICGSTIYHVTIADDPEDEDSYVLTGMECACCHAYTQLEAC